MSGERLLCNGDRVIVTEHTLPIYDLLSNGVNVSLELVKADGGRYRYTLPPTPTMPPQLQSEYPALYDLTQRIASGEPAKHIVASLSEAGRIQVKAEADRLFALVNDVADVLGPVVNRRGDQS